MKEKNKNSPQKGGQEDNLKGRQTPRQWMILILLVSLIGAGVSVELTSIYINVRIDPDYQSFCAISELANCDTVAVSKYSTFLGIPVSIWGLAAYTGLVSLCVWGLFPGFRPTPEWPLPLVFAASIFSVCLSLVLMGISFIIIKSFCPLCMTIYGLNFLLLLLSLFGMRAGGVKTAGQILEHPIAALRRPWLTFSGGLMVAALMSGVVAGYELMYSQVAEAGPIGPGGLPVGVDEDGNHWIGSRNPKLVIEEFSDYQCPFCRKEHVRMRKWIAEHAESARLVHRHLPLDHHCNPLVTRPYHLYSCEMARMAYCAGRQGKFWEMNDYFYSLQPGSKPPMPEAVALDLGLDIVKLKECIDSDYCLDCLMKDIQFCVERNIKSTPTYFMNGRMYPGGINDKDLENALREASGK